MKNLTQEEQQKAAEEIFESFINIIERLPNLNSGEDVALAVFIKPLPEMKVLVEKMFQCLPNFKTDYDTNIYPETIKYIKVENVDMEEAVCSIILSILHTLAYSNHIDVVTFFPKIASFTAAFEMLIHEKGIENIGFKDNLENEKTSAVFDLSKIIEDQLWLFDLLQERDVLPKKNEGYSSFTTNEINRMFQSRRAMLELVKSMSQADEVRVMPISEAKKQGFPEARNANDEIKENPDAKNN